jgi:hypothetical protein
MGILVGIGIGIGIGCCGGGCIIAGPAAARINSGDEAKIPLGRLIPAI